MKKGLLFILGVAFIASMGFNSCKKDHTCTCTVMGISADTVLKASSKKDAKSFCDKSNTDAATFGGSCTLK